MVKECKIIGHMYKAINSTFIYPIPKVDCPSYFDDFWPIFLSNYLYKIIVKIISNHLKPIPCSR